MSAPGQWVLPNWTARPAAPAPEDMPEPKPVPVSLTKRVRMPPRADLIYSANFRRPPVPTFRSEAAA